MRILVTSAGMMELEITFTRKDAPGLYLELLKVAKKHARSSEYMIQFMKKILTTISHVCDCKAFELELFQTFRMLIEAYQEFHSKLFPLPIPKLTPTTPGGVLVYITLEDSMRLPLSNKKYSAKKARVAARVALDFTSTSSRVATQFRGIEADA